ncbi:GNAT family N-acetyltransferase [Bacillus sp. WLY-B-L8]|uniref:GNAT family N-acetyltransferase n=1 Tax=Bacillus multifaciens TaxID=3068506 RepID=UPI002741771B|nr:GNAT family N-acetyltransferase [Bacillus sp. WLY-B-L8]MDP7978307.1 GNAT family N-acetyltransferase [Bacillus sp. WLY-B-L8]
MKLLDIKKDTNTFYVGEENKKEAEIHYVPTGKEKIIVDHTFVSDNPRGQGVGEALVKKIVEFAREEGKVIIPLCPFAKSQIERNADYHDVLAKY